MRRSLLVLLLASAAVAADPLAALASAPVVDEVRLAEADPGHRSTELPAGCSRIATQAGVVCRVLPGEGRARVIAVRLGEGKALVARATYLFEIDFAEDAPRTFVIVNRGDDTMRGVTCGSSLPDSVNRYTHANLESLDLPLSGRIQTWRSLFRLHDRTAGLVRERDASVLPLTAADGFWVAIAQTEATRHPGSAGAAVSAIRLRRIDQPERLDLAIRRPPAGLP